MSSKGGGGNVRSIRNSISKSKLVGANGGGGGGKERSSMYSCKLKPVLVTTALVSATGGVSVTISCKSALVMAIAKLEKSYNTEVE